MYPKNPTLILRVAFVCGLISTAITLIVAVISLARGDFNFSGTQINPYFLFDALIMGGLSAGIFFKSRICATLMALYFIYSKYIGWANGTGEVMNYVIGIFFIYVYIQGALASFEFHKEKKAKATNVIPPPHKGASPESAV